jgi:protein-tyrosine phosphatase
VIDLHAHILPGLDDGPPTTEAAVEMAVAAVRAGTRAVATTSHVNAGYGLSAGDIAAARAALAERLAADGIALELLAGGEVAPERLPDLDDEDLRELTLGGGPCVLLECPFAPMGSTMEPMVADLRRRGFAVLLAHPERSPTYQREPARLARLVELGAVAQVTGGALSGGFGDRAQRAAFGLLEAGLVHVLASDSHDSTHRPPDPRMAAGVLDDRYGDVEEQLAWMTEAVPAALVAGAPLPPRPPLPRPRGMRARLRAWSAR